MRLLLLLCLVLASPLSAQTRPAGGPGGDDHLEDGSDAPPTASSAAGGLVPAGRWADGPSYAIAGSATGVSFLASGGTVRAVDGASRHVLGEVVLPGVVYDLALDGTRLYAGVQGNRAGSGGLFVLDVSAPAQPTVVGAATGLSVYGIEVRGALAYLAAGSPARLVVADVSNPAQPSFTRVTPLSGFSYGLEVVGTTAYVALGTAGVAVVDVADPSAPVLTSTVPLPAYARRLEAGTVDGTPYLAVAAGSYADNAGAVYLLRLDGAAPTLVGSREFTAVAEDVAWAVSGPESAVALLVAASTNGVYTVSVGDPTFPYVFDQVYPTTANLVPGSNRVEAPAADQPALVADYYTGWQTVHESSFVQGPEGGSAVWAVVPDADDPAVVWAAAGALGLVRLDAAAPGGPRPTRRTRDNRWNFSYSVAQTGTTVYVADGYSGVWVVDKATGNVWVQLTDLPFADRVETVGNALVATGQGFMAVYLLDVPGAPVWVAGQEIPDAASLAHAGAVLYAGWRGAAGFSVVDLSAPASPVFLPDGGTEGQPVRVEAADGRLYVHASSATRARIYSTSAPGVPVPLGEIVGAPATATAVRATAYYTAVGGGGAAVTVYDATDPANVQTVSGAVLEAGTPFEMTATAGRILVATGTAGVYAFVDATVAGEAEPAASRLTVAAGPNPSRGAVSVVVRLPAPSALRVDVFDALGRRVATLADGAHAAGTVALSWPGRLPAGVYTVRASAGADVATARVTRLP